MKILPRSTIFVGSAVATLLALTVMPNFGQNRDAAASRKHQSDYMALGKVPEKARGRRNPLDSDPDALTAGKKLFDQRCSECHGKDARGGKRGPTLRVAAVREATPGEIFFVLTNGVIRHGMPGWSKLPEPQRWQIVSFLKSLPE